MSRDVGGCFFLMSLDVLRYFEIYDIDLWIAHDVTECKCRQDVT